MQKSSGSPITLHPSPITHGPHSFFNMQGPQTITDLESSLVRAKQATSRGDDFYGDHAFAKGGIGALVATGTARAGLIRLQQRAEAAKKLLGAGASQKPPSIRTARPMAASASASSHAPLNTTVSSAVSTRSISASHHSIAASRASFSPAATTPRACSVSPPTLGTAALASVVVGGAAGLPESARHEWQVGVPHPTNFVTMARSSRVSDMRPGSRWAGLSYYETSRDEVKRHLEINHILEQQHKEVRDGRLDGPG
jgi:hypothetical protein